MPGQITWTENFRILQAGSAHSPQAGHGPGLVVYNNFLYMVYVGEGNKNLWFTRLASTANYREWEQNQQVKSNGNALRSSDRPALAMTNNLVYMVYQGQGGTNLYLATFDGNQWSDDGQLPDQIQHPAGAGQYSLQQTQPSLCADSNGQLHLLYHAYLVPLPEGAVQNQILHSTYDPRRGVWSKPDVVASPYAHPAILQLGNLFALTATVAANQADSENLHFTTGTPGAWQNFASLNDNVLSTVGGVLVEFNNLLYIVYTGLSNKKIWYAWMNANAVASNAVLDNKQLKEGGWAAETSAALSAAVIDGELCVAYKGESSDNVWFVHGH